MLLIVCKLSGLFFVAASMAAIIFLSVKGIVLISFIGV